MQLLAATLRAGAEAGLPASAPTLPCSASAAAPACHTLCLRWQPTSFRPDYAGDVLASSRAPIQPLTVPWLFA